MGKICHNHVPGPSTWTMITTRMERIDVIPQKGLFVCLDDQGIKLTPSSQGKWMYSLFENIALIISVGKVQIPGIQSILLSATAHNI